MESPSFASSRAYRSLVWASLFMALVMTAGTVGYHVLGGPEYSWEDCFYMTFITVATIGYGEIVDLTHIPGGRLFTVFIATLGICTMTYMISTVTAFILESDINQAWRRKKMREKIAKLKGHYIVCGMGRVGGNVAHELGLTGRDCVIVDADMRQIDVYRERHPEQMYLHGDATDNDLLMAAGAMHASGLFAVASDDGQNMVISLSAKQLNPKLRVVARCHDMKNVEKTRRAGADDIVSPDFTGGLRIVSAMVRPHVVSFLDEMLKTDENLRMEEVVIPPRFSGSSLSMLYTGVADYIVLAVHQEGRWVFNPRAQHVVHEGDVLMVMTTPQGRAGLERLMLGVS